MDAVQEIKSLIVAQGDAFENFKKRNDDRLDMHEKALEDILIKANRPSLGGEGASSKALGLALRKAFSGDETELKSMSVGSDPEGGYLVVPQMDSIVRVVREEISPLSKLAREIILDSGAGATLPFVKGTLASAWIGEKSERPETDELPLGVNNIPLHEHYAMPAVTQKLLDTSNYDIGALIAEQIAHGLAVSEARALFAGNGVGKPRGLASYSTAATSDATRDWGVIEHIPTGASGAFHTTKGDPLFDVVAALQPQYRANARWMMSRRTAATLRKLKEATSDRYLWEPGMQIGQPDSLLGFPVTVCDDAPEVAADSLSIWFGDFQQAYAIVRQPGLKLLRDPYTSKGTVKFYAYARIGGDLINSEAVKALKFAST